MPGVPVDERQRRGQQTRRAVLGDEHVRSSDAALTEFSRPVREFVNEFAWGAVWSRPGLPLNTRSLLNLVMLTALGRPRELAIHLHGALRNGCTRTEIQEALLQATVYCGIPAGLEAFRVAEQVLGPESRV